MSLAAIFEGHADTANFKAIRLGVDDVADSLKKVAKNTFILIDLLILR